ncbi:MAG: PPC domain-containing protein [Candidatus Thorarchaeota archaeon]
MRHVKQATSLVALAVILILAVTSGALSDQQTASQAVRFTPADTQTGYLSEGEYELYSFIVWADAEQIKLTLNGPSTGDFDLYANYGSEATPGYSDYSSEGLTSYEQIIISNPSSGTWYTSVYAYSGYGSYSLTLTVDYEDSTTTTTTTTGGSGGGGSGGGSSSSTSTTSTTNIYSPYIPNPSAEETTEYSQSTVGISSTTVIGYLFLGGLVGLGGLYIIKSRMDSKGKKEDFGWGPKTYSGPSTPPRPPYPPSGSYSTPRRIYTDTPRPGERYQPRKYTPRPPEEDEPEWG